MNLRNFEYKMSTVSNEVAAYRVLFISQLSQKRTSECRRCCRRRPQCARSHVCACVHMRWYLCVRRRTSLTTFVGSVCQICRLTRKKTMLRRVGAAFDRTRSSGIFALKHRFRFYQFTICCHCMRRSAVSFVSSIANTFVFAGPLSACPFQVHRENKNQIAQMD